VLGKFARPSRVAWRGPDGDFHAASLSSAFRVDPSHPNVLLEDDEIVPGNYYDLAYEPGGAIWLATQDGIHRQAALNWNPPPGLRQFTDPVRAIHEGTNGQLFFLCARHLVTFDGEEWRKFVWPEGLDSGVAPESVSLLLPNGSLLFESEDGGYRVVTGKGEVRTFNPTPNARVRLLGSYQSGALLSHSTNANGAAPELLVYTGEQLRPTDLARLPADFGPPNWAYAGPSGRLLLAGTNGLALLQGSQWLVAGAREFGGPTEFTCAVEGPDGRLLVGSQRNLWEFDGKNWTASQLSFDRVNALQVARDGSLWCASRNGLHRLARGTWLPAGIEEGLPADAVTRVFEDSKGRLWAGTTRGIALFRPDADLDPPRTTILTSAKREIPASEASITIQYRGRDKWKSTPASRLLYSYSLDGRDWTAYTTETSVSLSDLAPGTHRFQVKAADRSGNIEPKPALLEFSVALPWYQETRLMVFTGFGVLTALFFAWLALNRHRELARSHAEIEKIVQVRTEQLERAHDELLHSEKMRALGTLAAGIAHDFNNILSIIKGSTQIIENNLQNRDKVLTRTQRIRTVVQQGTEIVQAMLGFSRLPEQQIALCDVNQVASDTLRLLGDHFLQRMKLELDLAAGLPSVPASKNFLQQILLNFIFNAADATEGAGRIILHTGRVERTSSPLALAPERAPGYLFIAVQDFGSGIVQDVVSRIFEPFFTTKGFSARRGTGLGLTMVYELAAKMGCGLKVESVRGKGSTFTVFVPIRPWPVSEELAEKAFKPLTAQEHT
jgi:signal transduction histidine kinase